MLIELIITGDHEQPVDKGSHVGSALVHKLKMLGVLVLYSLKLTLYCTLSLLGTPILYYFVRSVYISEGK